jgi:FkbM family methyltransferase
MASASHRNLTPLSQSSLSIGRLSIKGQLDNEKEDKIKHWRVTKLIKLATLILAMVMVACFMFTKNNFATNEDNQPPSDETTSQATNFTAPTSLKQVQPSQQDIVVQKILNRTDLKTIQSKWCINKPQDDTSFLWVSQGDGTLPPGHVENGIEKKIGILISTILSAETNKSKFMIDVGMNSGFFSVMSASLHFPVLAFDPQPVCHALMQKTMDLNHYNNTEIQTYLMGLGNGGRNIESFVEMHITSCHGGYSWPDVWEKDSSNAVKVPIRSLSEMIGDRAVSVMKMDTEGNEASILASGIDIFEKRQVDYLIVEMKPIVWESRDIDTSAIYALEKLALSVVKIDENKEKKKGDLFRDGDYLFQFAKVPVSQMDVVAFKRC